MPIFSLIRKISPQINFSHQNYSVENTKKNNLFPHFYISRVLCNSYNYYFHQFHTILKMHSTMTVKNRWPRRRRRKKLVKMNLIFAFMNILYSLTFVQDSLASKHHDVSNDDQNINDGFSQSFWLQRDSIKHNHR